MCVCLCACLCVPGVADVRLHPQLGLVRAAWWLVYFIDDLCTTVKVIFKWNRTGGFKRMISSGLTRLHVRLIRFGESFSFSAVHAFYPRKRAFRNHVTALGPGPRSGWTFIGWSNSALGGAIKECGHGHSQHAMLCKVYLKVVSHLSHLKEGYTVCQGPTVIILW